MNLKDLKEQVSVAIDNLKDHGKFPKENNHYDYKMELNFFGITDPTEIFMRNFAKDILSFGNSNGGIILLGIKEDKINGTLEDVGLDIKNLSLFDKLDLNDISQKFQKIAKSNVDIDLQSFQLGTRKYYYLLIGKQNQVIIPINDFLDYKLKKGDIVYRVSSNNKIANETTQDFNHFLQIKSNEKSKEFMEIWSKLLPEIFDINPREILIINPKNNTVYGFNGKDNVLSSSEIEIDKSEDGIFNIILNAISAGDIGKISDDEGKPLYKIVGEVKSLTPRDFISLSTLWTESLRIAKYKFSNFQIKSVVKYLDWVYDEKFKVENPPENTINLKYSTYIWLETLDTIKDSHKVVFSKEAINMVVQVIDDSSLHKTVFKRNLELKK
ncbi:ATP-binding protein [Flavobacterium chilense]|uniref:Putative DNA-binding domain-containing protein n=1 Tax=Flavobacterium chilense TaxID=946677 RepID=A0A1M6XFJ3_9FLAO|nr:ATP-binding protein [Flavobacterium chilense]SHL04609.1 Putative DNA-binding domain-containing protein [Flavobacterium chilense]